MTEAETSTLRWRWTALILYLLIYRNLAARYTTNNINENIKAKINATEDTLVQMELMKKLTGQHSPFTLMGGGLFHLAFGAILTGSAVGLNK